ncbi:ras GTPase-activating-like protein IQGAP3 [Tiliqua scincoides]|uniref:ras GTPase-activating-like protein IQGAP3 n=1 Tax=Tiliqua scincoides TaxID=71010 RepID=UPI003461DAEA
MHVYSEVSPIVQNLPGSLPDERLTADEMDERRRQNIAYQYLCRLEEAKRWMEACLQEDLASPTELEESLRNGVLLAKLGHFFAPDVVPLRKIYDLDQAQFQACGLCFRHTDNINRWRSAMSHVGLPTIFHPETTDIYDKKNMPRVVYCIHALSLYLFRLGLAPPIQDLYGKVNFTDEEIDHMKCELEKYGLQLPSFSKIGGILANEISVDEAAVHAAVLAINEAVEVGIVERTAAALLNPSARLAGLLDHLAADYQVVLSQAKMEKASSGKTQVSRGAWGDIYDRCLTQAELQRCINQVNVKAALQTVDEFLERQDPEAVYVALQDPVLALRNLRRKNTGWYWEQLSADREQKALEVGYLDLLDREELQAGISVANERADQEYAMLQAVRRIHAALLRGVAEETVQALMDPDAQLPEVFHFAAELYQQELSALLQQHQGELLQEELFVAVEMLSAVALVNQALDDGDAHSFWRSLASPGLGLSELEEGNAQHYFEDLSKWKRQPRDGRGGFLSWNDLQASVDGVNASVQAENEKILAVRLINQALDQGDAEKTFTALLLPAAGLCDVMLPVAKRYHDVLAQARRQKAQVTGDTGAMLWWEEIKRGVSRANEDSRAAKRMALGIAAINQAIKEGNAAQTVRVLHNPDVCLCGVVVECARAYQEKLGALMTARKLPGPAKAEWVRHRLKDGAEYFFSLQTFEGSWDPPRPCALNTTHLSREEIQSAVAQVTAAHDRARLWDSSLQLVVQLQAHMRGFLFRQKFAARRRFFLEQIPAAVKIQACWRRHQQRRRYLERLQYFRENTDAVIKIQAWLRMWSARRQYLKRLHFFRKNVDAVIKIQAFVRANKTRGDYRMLMHSQNPPLRIVRRFAHLLEQSQRDYREEAELLDLQESVVKGIRSNQQLEADLNLMDIKIGLLVKNRITLQEVVSHCRRLTRKNKEQLSDLMGLGRRQGLKALSKEKRRALEAYQHLFYQLQTHPVYLARLIMQMPQNKSTRFMESVVFALYNYASNAREAFLLLQMFRSALQEEIESKVDQIRDILTGNPMVIRLVVSFYRSPRGQNALRQILGGPVQEVLQNKTLSIRTDPVEIYKGWINQMESQSGQKSNLPYDVSPEQALSHPEVQRRLDISLRHLLAMADKFLLAITSSVEQIPYGMRYIARVLKRSLAEKFPKAAKEEIYKVVGNLLYYRFMNPAVVAPDGFDVIDLTAGVALHPDHRRNLGSIAKILQHAAANQPFEGEKGHLRVVNQYLEEAHQKFRKFISAACSVPEPEERFNVDKYSEMVTIAKPVVYITAGELINTHKLLLEHRVSVAPDPRDPLHELLEDLGELPTLQSLVGENEGNGANGNPEQSLLRLGRMEISLTLSCKFDTVEADVEGKDARSLLLSTKQMLVDVFQAQPGDSLVEILRTEASEGQEALHQHLMRKRAVCNAQAPEKLRPRRSLSGNSHLSVEEKKRKVIRNLRRLESLGLVDSTNQYQDIINEMAKDIRNQRQHRQRRRTELTQLRQTLFGLHSKRTFCEEQVDFYSQYIQSSLDSLTVKSKCVAKPSKKQPMLHYTAARLCEKGVLLEIEDLPATQLKNVVFEIVPSGEAGRFQVKAKFLGIDMETFPLHYQDLLQLQYEGVSVMKMFDRAKINVNLLIFLLNKKFFKK